MSEAKKYWDRIYGGQSGSLDKAPNAFLQQTIERLPKGKALDMAMGEGENAVYLALNGYQVRGFDISDVAVQRATELARKSQVAIEAKCTDIDLFLMGLMEYDLIIMTCFKPAVTRTYTEMVRALKQGGYIVIDSFGTPEMTEPLGKTDVFKDFYFSSNEILRHFRDLRIAFYQEGLVDGRHRVQCLAQKPLDKDAVKYGLFDMHTAKSGQERSPELELAEKFFKK